MSEEYNDDGRYEELMDWSHDDLCYLILRLEHQLAQQKAMLDEAVKVIEFYGNRFSWNFSLHPDHEYYAGAIKDDDSLLKYKEKDGEEFEDYCGGKRARAFLEKVKNV